MRKLSSRVEIFLFVSVVLMVAWLPLILFKPVPESAVVAEGLLSGSEELFPEVEGYSLLVVDEEYEDVVKDNLIGADVLINEDTVSSFLYWREDEQVLLVVEKIKSGSVRYLEEQFKKEGWAVDLEKEWQREDFVSRGFRAKKEDSSLSVVYWPVSLFKQESKLLFFSTPRGTETVLICIVTPLDFDSEKRLDLISEGAVFPVLKRVYQI